MLGSCNVLCVAPHLNYVLQGILLIVLRPKLFELPLGCLTSKLIKPTSGAIRVHKHKDKEGERVWEGTKACGVKKAMKLKMQ